MTFLDSLFTKQGKLYLAIGLGILALILIIVAVIAYFSTGDTTTAGSAGGAGVAAAAAAAEALRRRTQAQVKVDTAKTDTVKTGEAITENHDKATADMNAVPEEVKNMTDEEKVTEGNKLFGGK